MANTAVDNAKLARADQFLERLKFLMTKKCLAVLAADSTANLREREFAVRVINDLDTMIGKVAWLVVSQGNTLGTYTVGPPEDSTQIDDGLNADIATAWPLMLDIA